MPQRNQTIIRRDINRLNELVARSVAVHPVFLVLAQLVAQAAANVNNAWQALQAATVGGVKERKERDTAIGRLLGWIQRWRPLCFIMVPGARESIRMLPSDGATPDDVIRVAEDMRKLLGTNLAAVSFKDQALADLGGMIEETRKETDEASVALPVEAAARDAHSDACNKANAILVEGLHTVRAIFGPTSPEYKQFIAKDNSKEDEGSTEQGPVAGKK
jgi:hypothetical protein